MTVLVPAVRMNISSRIQVRIQCMASIPRRKCRNMRMSMRNSRSTTEQNIAKNRNTMNQMKMCQRMMNSYTAQRRSISRSMNRMILLKTQRAIMERTARRILRTTERNITRLTNIMMMNIMMMRMSRKSL